MRKFIIKVLVFICAMLVLLFTLAACGTQALDKGEKPASEQKDASIQSIPPVDKNASADELLGSWVDNNDSERFANITKADTAYEYEDNDGKYNGKFNEGVLTVKVSDSETADVYIDHKSGHMILLYQGIPTEFRKK